MHTQRKTLVALNLLGGIAVLASYAHGLTVHADQGDLLWGGVPQGLRPLYTVSMLLAAAGYFPFTFYILFRLDPGQGRMAGGLGYGWFNFFYLLILAPSALWLPLTFAVIERWDPMLWLAIRVVLALVAIGSLGILFGLLTVAPRPRGSAYSLAVAGAIAFCVQTVVLDASVWPAYFTNALP